MNEIEYKYLVSLYQSLDNCCHGLQNLAYFTDCSEGHFERLFKAIQLVSKANWSLREIIRYEIEGEYESD